MPMIITFGEVEPNIELAIQNGNSNSLNRSRTLLDQPKVANPTILQIQPQVG